MSLGFDPVTFRSHFPVFHNRNGTYLDNAATTMTPQAVIDALNTYYLCNRVSVGRSGYRAAIKATAQVEETREQLAQFINLPPGSALIFCSGATAAINMVAQALPWQPGDNIITTLLEHNSNLLPWMRLADRGAELRIAKPEPDGRLETHTILDLMDRRTRLIAITHTSNVLGCVPPLECICKEAREQGILTLVDGAQAFGHMPVDLVNLGCDAYVASAHKAYGPTGIGLLALSDQALEQFSPPWAGGGMVSSVDLDGYQAFPAPAGWEAGTPPIAEIIAWHEAIPIHKTAIAVNALAYINNLTELLMRRLMELEEVTVWGSTEPVDHHGIVAFSIEGIPCHRVCTMLDELSGVMVRSGAHCAMLLHQQILEQPEGSIRASLAPYNQPEDIEKLIDGIQMIIHQVRIKRTR
jgi:cysteine desulfurase/selenocysteine lyase